MWDGRRCTDWCNIRTICNLVQAVQAGIGHLVRYIII